MEFQQKSLDLDFRLQNYPNTAPPSKAGAAENVPCWLSTLCAGPTWRNMDENSQRGSEHTERGLKEASVSHKTKPESCGGKSGAQVQTNEAPEVDHHVEIERPLSLAEETKQGREGLAALIFRYERQHFESRVWLDVEQHKAALAQLHKARVRFFAGYSLLEPVPGTEKQLGMASEILDVLFQAVVGDLPGAGRELWKTIEAMHAHIPKKTEQRAFVVAMCHKGIVHPDAESWVLDQLERRGALKVSHNKAQELFRRARNKQDKRRPSAAYVAAALGLPDDAPPDIEQEAKAYRQALKRSPTVKALLKSLKPE